MSGFSEMLNHVRTLPEQLAQALHWEYDAVAEQPPGDIKNVVVAGMGGSAIGGDLLRCCLGPELPVPVMVNRDYRLPGFVDQHTLVLLATYSGSTEESLSCFREAQGKGARIVGITSGGELQAQCGAAGIPAITIPPGFPPRTALGYLFAPMVLALEKLGLIKSGRANIEETMAVLRELREELDSPGPDERNPAWRIALGIKDTLPVIWAAGSTLEAAAMRWKAQINENAKAPAYYNCFPELNHNEFCGFDALPSLNEKLSVVVLQDESLNARINKRVAVTGDMMRGRIKGVHYVQSRGSSLMAKLFSLIYMADFSSVYLAQLYGIDPIPIPLIDEMKRRLKD